MAREIHHCLPCSGQGLTRLSVILGYYFNSHIRILSVFELATGVIISCVCWIPRNVIATSPILTLCSGNLDLSLSDVYEH